ncbi:MAG TPA: hypothetical protein EYP90_05060 [Chromatiaceae bacterium]|nr:hypothetical protein [Chromatiaceae bacterium]
MYTQLLKIGLLAGLIVLVACGSETAVTSTPILPPPNISAGGDDVVGGATLVPGVVPSVTPGGDTAVTPTPTLAPTNTPTPTAEATAVTNPPTQAVTAAPLPATSRNLLFLADGAFRQWNHKTRQIATILPGADPASRVQKPGTSFSYPRIVGDIANYDMSADGKRAVVSRLIDRVGIREMFELLYVDMISREVWTIIPQVSMLDEFALSPDASQLAFVSVEQTSSLDDEWIYRLFVIPTGGGNLGTARQVRECSGRCAGLVWNRDSNLFAFRDYEALWLVDLEIGEPTLLLINSVLDREQWNPDVDAFYTPIEWANNGHYLLLWNGNGSQSVLDIPTGQIVDVPNTLVRDEPFPVQTMWMPDNRLYILRSISQEGSLMPTAELWRIQPENGVVLREEWAILSDQPLGASGQQYLEDGRFAYVLFAHKVTPNPAAGVYILKGMAETPQRVNAVPPIVFTPNKQYGLWVADGSGVLIVDGLQVYYAPAQGDALYEVTAVLGSEAHRFQWQPEIVVP